MKTGSIFICTLLVSAIACALAGRTAAAELAAKANSTAEALYIGNREPLAPSPFMKLPIGSITPKGWLRHQLELEAAGMIGRLLEISKWCKFESNAWAAADGQGHSG